MMSRCRSDVTMSRPSLLIRVVASAPLPPNKLPKLGPHISVSTLPRALYIPILYCTRLKYTKGIPCRCSCKLSYASVILLIELSTENQYHVVFFYPVINWNLQQNSQAKKSDFIVCFPSATLFAVTFLAK